MRLFTLFAVLAAALVLAVTASAQAPTVAITPKPSQTISQLIVSGFGYTVTSNGPIELNAKLTMKYKGKTLKLTKSLRAESNAGEVPDPVEYGMPQVSEKVAKTLRKLKKVTVTLTVAVTDADGSHQTLTAKAKLKKG
jgi:hypothetical protein